MLSMSAWWLIALNNDFVFPDPEPSIFNIVYGWSGVCGQFGLRYFIFSVITSTKLIIFVLFYYIVIFSSSFSLTKSFFALYAYFIESIDWILLWSFELKGILLIHSVKTCLFLLNFCCVFNINLLFFINCLWHDMIYHILWYITIYHVSFIFLKTLYYIFKLASFYTAFIIFKVFFLRHTFFVFCFFIFTIIIY